MSRDDLLLDLRDELAARPAAPPAPPRELPTGQGAPLTPAFDLSVTPLKWALPSVGPVPQGVGVAARLGPLQVSVGLR